MGDLRKSKRTKQVRATTTETSYSEAVLSPEQRTIINHQVLQTSSRSGDVKRCTFLDASLEDIEQKKSRSNHKCRDK